MEDDDTFQAEGGGSTTFPKQCSSLRKNDHVVLEGRPCKITQMSTSNGEVHIVGVDIFTGDKYEDNCPSDDNMKVPFIKRHDYQLLAIQDDGSVSLLDMETQEERCDLNLPQGQLGQQIRDAFAEDETGIMVVVTISMGEEMMKSFKNMPKD